MTNTLRNSLNLLALADTDTELQDRIAAFIREHDRLPTLGETPAWYLYKLSSRQELIDMLRDNFIVELVGNKLKVLYFANV